MEIRPVGTELASTNAHEAICVVFVPKAAVGAVGVPVNAGLLVSALDAIADAIALYSLSISVPLITFAGSVTSNESLAAKLVAFV